MKKFIFLPIVLFTIACGSDPEPDIRNAAVGTYTGTYKVYYIDGTDVIETGDPEESTSATLSKGSNSLTILINWEGDIITGTKVKKAAGGFGFDINSLTFDGTTFSGYAGLDIDGVEYHGGFDSTSNELAFYLQYTDSGTTYIIEVMLEKQ